MTEISLGAIPSLSKFDDASAAVVAYLEQAMPMALWAVTRFDGDHQIFLTTSDNELGAAPRYTRRWETTMCSLMIEHRIPQIVPDTSAEPLLAESDDPAWAPIKAYMGLPIARADGTLFGTVCGYDVETHTTAMTEHLPLLELLSGLLGTVLEADHLRADAERRAQSARIDAETDPLTGLPNRRGWNRFLSEEDDRWEQFGDPGAVVVTDLDRMKEVNDRFGHAAGDEVIRRTADVLRDWAGDLDVVARLGGDEFGIVLTDCGPDTVTLRIDDLHRALAVAGIPMSIGYCSIVGAGGAASAWTAADQVMYDMKKAGRSANRAASSEPGDITARAG